MTNAAAGANTASTGREVADILRVLAKQRRTGTLKIADASGRAKFLYFADGEVEFLKSRKGKTLIGRALMLKRKVSEQDLARALKRHLATGEKLGRSCLALGLCREDDIREALAFQAVEEVSDLLLWPHARSEFHRGDPPLDVFDFDDLGVKLRLDPQALVREAEKRGRELEQARRSIPSTADVYAPSPEAMYAMKRPAEGSPEADLLRFVDGVRDVEEILSSVPLSDIDVLSTLDRLVRAGDVAPLGPTQLQELAGECEREGNLEKAHRLYLRAEELGLDQLDLPNRIAKLADGLGMRDEAERRYLEFGERCDREELPEAAVAAFKKALDVNPSSLGAMERIVPTLVRLGKAGEAVAMLKQLVARCDPERERDRVHRAWAEVLKLAPEDVDAHRGIARCHLQGGDRVQAIIELEELAAIFLSGGDPARAIDVLREIVGMDGECVEARLELAATYTNVGRTAEAVEEYERLAETLAKSGIGGEATNWQFLIDINEKIVSLAPENRRARQWLAQAYDQKAEADKAVAHYEGLILALEKAGAPAAEIASALKQYTGFRPDDFVARERLASLLAGAGRRDEAVAVLRDAGEAALKTHRFDVVARLSEAILALEPFDLEARRAIARVALIEKDEVRAARRWREVAELAVAAKLFPGAHEAVEKALEIAADADSRRLLAAVLEAEGKNVEAARALVSAARDDFAAEDYGRSRKAAERALALCSEVGEARDLLFMLDQRRDGIRTSTSAHARIPPAPDRPPTKPTITGGNPDVTIIDRPRRKYGSIANVSEKLRAIRDPSSSSAFSAAAAAASEEATVEPATAPKRTLGAAAKLKAMKGGGSPDPVPPAEPSPAAPGAAASPSPARPLPETAAIPPSEPVAVAQPARKAVAAADRLKRLKGGGAAEGASIAPVPAVAPAELPVTGDAASAELAAKLQKAEQGEIQEGGARRALTAAARLKALGKRG